jgi:kumamolisin
MTEKRHRVAVSVIDHGSLHDEEFSGTRPDPDKVIEVAVVLRSRCPDKDRLAAIHRISTELPQERENLSVSGFEEKYGMVPGDFELIREFAGANKLEFVRGNVARCDVVLRGTLAHFSYAFGVHFLTYQHADYGEYRSYDGPVYVPEQLSDVVLGVLGFDARPLPHLPSCATGLTGVRSSPQDVARFYHFPEGATGRGQNIGIVELGGGFHRADVEAFLAKHGLKSSHVTVIEMDGAKNRPASMGALQEAFQKQGLSAAKNPRLRLGHWLRGHLDPVKDSERNIAWTTEATMDVELIAGFANEAHLLVYFAPNMALGKYNAFQDAIFDPKTDISVISCSWGTQEDNLPASYLQLMDRIYQFAVLRGITICHSSGDDGPSIGEDGKPHVHFPASSPYVLACGGTHVYPEKSEEKHWREMVGEHVFESGHGVSSHFAEPHWQAGHRSDERTSVPVQGRRVPDVVGKADLATGYDCVVGQISVPGGGTSASAPMWASLIALVNEQLGVRAGYITPLLYHPQFKHATRKIGAENEAGGATPGWHPRHGLGSPDGTSLLAALRARPD